MGSVRIIVLAVAAVAAIGLAWVVQRMIANRPPPPQVQAAAGPAQPTVSVLVAKRALPSGTRIAQADVGWTAWPVEALNPAFITDRPPPAGGASAVSKAGAKPIAAPAPALTGPEAIKDLVGAVVRDPIMQNEPIVASKVVKAGEGGFMAAMLLPGMQAVALPVTVESAAGGFILPGDRVDVVVSRKDGSGPLAGATQTVLQNVRVLAIDQKTAPDQGAKTMVGSTATLEVPAANAPALLRARSQGDVSLTLRSYADMGGSASAGGVAAMQGVTVVRYGMVSQANQVASR